MSAADAVGSLEPQAIGAETHQGFSAGRWAVRLLVLAGVVGLVLVSRGQIEAIKQRGKQRMAQRIEIVQSRPPPQRIEPKQKDEEKPPPPEEKSQDARFADDQAVASGPVDDQPPSTDQLGVIGEGGAGGDSFGLVARARGRDVTAAPKPAVVQSAPAPDTGMYRLYADGMKREFQEVLTQDMKVRVGQYKIELAVWVDAQGNVDQFEVRGSTGDAAVDQEIRTAVGSVRKLKQPPPHGMPQPVRLRITSTPQG
jgi:TonB family protein